MEHSIPCKLRGHDGNHDYCACHCHRLPAMKHPAHKGIARANEIGRALALGEVSSCED